jgi:DNA-binding beta-propeller fold protein YncE
MVSAQRNTLSRSSTITWCSLALLLLLPACKEKCKELAPQFQVSLDLASSVDPSQIAMISVLVTINGKEKPGEFIVSKDSNQLADRTTSFKVELGNTLQPPPASVDVLVTAKDSSDRPLASQRGSFTMEPNGCNFFTMTLASNTIPSDSGPGEGVRKDSGGRWIVSTLAGSSVAGFKDGDALSALFQQPWGVAVTSAGIVYVAEYGNHRVRKIWKNGAQLRVDTVAGTGKEGFQDGEGGTAQFAFPTGLCVDHQGSLFVADLHNHHIRGVYFPNTNPQVSRLAGDPVSCLNGFKDGTGDASRFDHPQGVAADDKNKIYVADQVNNRIRLIDRTKDRSDPGFVSTIAASFNNPHGVAVGPDGKIYVADTGSNLIRVIDADGVKLLAGEGAPDLRDGPAATSRFNGPIGIAVGSAGKIYIADTGNHCIRIIDTTKPSSSLDFVTRFAGTGRVGSDNGPALEASFNNPKGVAVDSSGWIYVADFDNHRIRLIRWEQP